MTGIWKRSERALGHKLSQQYVRRLWIHIAKSGRKGVRGVSHQRIKPHGMPGDHNKSMYMRNCCRAFPPTLRLWACSGMWPSRLSADQRKGPYYPSSPSPLSLPISPLIGRAGWARTGHLIWETDQVGQDRKDTVRIKVLHLTIATL